MRRGYRTGTLFVLAWAALVSPLGGCSAEAPADQAGERIADAATPRPAAAPEVSGCELLTPGEIEAAMGVAPDRAEADTDLRGCSWDRADGRPLIAVVTSVAHRTYEEYMQNLREQLGPDLEDLGMSRVEGVGDYAIWHEQDGPSYLNAVEDGRLLGVIVYREPAGGGSKRKAAVELARQALPRL